MSAYSVWLQASNGKSAKTCRTIVAKMAPISVYTGETDHRSNVWDRNYTGTACFYWIHATNCSKVSTDRWAPDLTQGLVAIVCYNCFLDVFQMPNSIIHRIGMALVVTTHGKLFTMHGIILERVCLSDYSLPYLDPTDPFFQQVGAAILNEVCRLSLLQNPK